MEEAAMLDGASHFKIMTKIYLPLSAPILATIALWVAVGKWNDWMTGLLYVDEKSLYIMQNYLRTVLISSYSAETNNPDILNKGNPSLWRVSSWELCPSSRPFRSCRNILSRA